MLACRSSLQPFLKCFLTPADTAKAWYEPPLLNPEGQSVETEAAKCNNTNSRITEGTAVNSTTFFNKALLARKSDTVSLHTAQSTATPKLLLGGILCVQSADTQ